MSELEIAIRRKFTQLARPILLHEHPFDRLNYPDRMAEIAAAVNMDAEMHEKVKQVLLAVRRYRWSRLAEFEAPSAYELLGAIAKEEEKHRKIPYYYARIKEITLQEQNAILRAMVTEMLPEFNKVKSKDRVIKRFAKPFPPSDGLFLEIDQGTLGPGRFQPTILLNRPRIEIDLRHAFGMRAAWFPFYTSHECEAVLGDILEKVQVLLPEIERRTAEAVQETGSTQPSESRQL